MRKTWGFNITDLVAKAGKRTRLQSIIRAIDLQLADDLPVREKFRLMVEKSACEKKVVKITKQLEGVSV